MDKLKSYRAKQTETVNKLQSTSPQKFGKAPSTNTSSSFTPSKLANNPLFKDASNMKKNEQTNSKVRQTEALVSIYKEKIKHLQEQKQGIQQSLTQQISMYKKMNKELQTSHGDRIKQLQKAFNDEIQKIIQDKEEEAKYVQSQKELLENRINELENIISEMKDEFNNFMADFEKLSGENEKMGEDLNKIHSKNQQLQNKMKGDSEKYRKDIEELNKSLEDQAKQSKLQLQKQSARLNALLTQKQKAVEDLNKNLKEQKEKLLQITKSHASQYANLQAQRNKLKEALDKSIYEHQKSKEELKRSSSNATQTTDNYVRVIEDLKKRIEDNQRRYLKERQNWTLQGRELREQILILRKNVEKCGFLANENAMLTQEVKHLQELLIQSSMQMERCKDQFARQDIEKQNLFKKLRELDEQNENLYRLKHEMEDEARCWRESYYKSRH